jgi:hypothetical protein
VPLLNKTPLNLDNHIRDNKVVKIVPGNAKTTTFDNADGASGQSKKVTVFDFFK